MNIDPDVEKLFKRVMVIDGALYPYFRTGLQECCEDSENEGECLPQSRAEADHGCYGTDVPKDFRVVERRMGVNIGAGPYTDDQAEKTRRRREAGGNIRLIKTSNDLDRAIRNNDFGNLLYLQSWREGHYNLSPIKLANHLFRLGARIVQPAYNRRNNAKLKRPFAGGADDDDMKLTKSGKQLVKALFERFVLVDLSHVGNQSALDIIRMALKAKRPVTANHANAIGVFDDRKGSAECVDGCASRNHTDEVICGVAKTGGVIGFTPIRFMFAPVTGNQYSPASETDFLRHVDYVARQLKCKNRRGKARQYIDMTHHISLASDGRLNGYDPKVKWLHMKMGTQLNRWKRIATRLKNECGYSLKTLERLIGSNLERVYREALPGVRRPVLLKPSAGKKVTSGKVHFKWKKPVVNQPKGKGVPSIPMRVPTDFRLVIERKQGGQYKRVKNVDVGKRLFKKMKLAKGKYRWFVKAKNSVIDVNSHWRYFEKR